MNNVLVVAELKGGSLRKTSLPSITFAKQAVQKLGGQVHALVCGDNVAAAAEELRKYGVAVVWTATSPALQNYTAEAFAAAAIQAAEAAQAGIVCASATAQGRDYLPRVAARIGAGMASDIVGLEDIGGKMAFKRPMFAGNLHQWVELTTARKVVSVRPTDFEAAPAGAAGGEVKALPLSLDAAALKTRFVEFAEVKSERPELADARVVVSGGRGTKGPEGYKETVEVLADVLGAAVGATRAIVDAGWVPNDWQVGQTGKVIAPELYIGLGLSGAIQHLAGMAGSKVIVSINKDPDAPLFKVADYGVVTDLFKAVPEMIEEIKKLQS
ncbi:MAG: electron transfer flavoprotein subunit alpha/FixB family protein [Deltaproteobacteria bacterium]|nr:electron transfer flavoprotein subunit alpha/FixB family protein [Deltaproteobacteria bacterium]